MTYVSYMQCDECNDRIDGDAPFTLTIITPSSDENEWGNREMFHFCLGSHLVQWLNLQEAEGKIEDTSQAVLFGSNASRS